MANINSTFEIDLELKMRHPDVRRLQCLLNSMPDTCLAESGPGSPGQETDYYGQLTASAVMKFQTKHGLIAAFNEPGAGRAGSKTRAKIKEIFSNNLNQSTTKTKIDLDSDDLLKSPPSQSRCFEIYGDSREDTWKKQNFVRCDLSTLQSELQHVVIGWQTSTKAFTHNGWFGFYCHKLVVPKFQKAFQALVKNGLANELKTFDGCFNIREIRGSNAGWSTHSWAIALDINAEWNKQGQQNFELSEEFARCFEDIGFVWGGRWAGKYIDPMHFQYATVE